MKTVRTLIVFFVLVAAAHASFAQGNLQFNQVIFYDFPYGSTQAINVPSGKVWKIESVGASASSCAVYLQNSSSQNTAFLYYGSASGLNAQLPMWLPSGFTGFFAYNINSCTNSRAVVSIIEFNVVP